LPHDLSVEDLLPQFLVLTFVKFVTSTAHERYLLDNMASTELVQSLKTRFDHLTAKTEANQADRLVLEWILACKSTCKNLSCLFSPLGRIIENTRQLFV